MTLCKTQINDYVVDTTKELSNYCQAKYDLGVDWKVAVTLDYSPRRKNHYGGITTPNNKPQPFVSLALHGIQHYKVKAFKEYDMFAKDKTIGSIKTTSWKIYLKCLLVHEITHCVQWYLPSANSSLEKEPFVYEGLPDYEGNHKQFFQAIYSDLRIKFVNHLVTPDKIGVVVTENLGESYSPFITKINV